MSALQYLCERCKVVDTNDACSAYCEQCNEIVDEAFRLDRAKDIIAELLCYVDKKTAIAFIKGENK